VRLPAVKRSTMAPCTTPPGFDYEPVAFGMLDTDCERVATECVYEQDAALLFRARR
jgi:hypothetical protein